MKSTKVDERHVFCLFVRVRFHRFQAPHRGSVGVDPALRRDAHVRQVDQRRHVAAVAPALVGRLREPAREVVERQVGAPLRAENERCGCVRRAAGAQVDGHRHHAVRAQHLREVEAVVREAVRRERTSLRDVMENATRSPL